MKKMNDVNRDIETREAIPIVVTAFGTTAKAFSTYEKMDALFKREMPEQPVFWAYSSRMVKHAMRRNTNLDLKDPAEVLLMLQQQGHPWAVLQSLHIIGGHELHRLASEGRRVDIRLSFGLPLLSSPQDYMDTAHAMKPLFSGTGFSGNDVSEKDCSGNKRAVVLIGHGTDHPAWTSYFALESIMRDIHGTDSIFTGVVEGFPEMDTTVQRIKQAGFSKVLLVPFMLVAGVHFQEDLTGDDDSWQAAFEAQGIDVSLIRDGIGVLDGISRIFVRHIKEALDVIPL
ncbi:CbiK3 [Desulfamplus magnetovallimortis]|uniref:CbiK3 n=1 Tax=Desulfamplus magnetovallimortis TaxID=1246637 RepID=A0A1W1HHD1_9BACT|nr:sirohydrochlorin cobaltochelatase [Desulfamplus magnetovallimortis]SLM31907.1 CbiK3 [Desulfamplus magnetovallimortis]